MIEYFQLTSEEISALYLSAKIGLFSVITIAIPGIICAWILARKNFKGKILFDAFLHIPLVIPPVVTGYLLLLLLGKNGFIGKSIFDYLGISFAFSWQGAVIASALMGFPLMIRSIRLSIEQIDPRLEQAARTMGASPLRVFFTITLPLSLPGIITGMILAFARSLGEFGATITFVSNIEGVTRTLPLAIYSYIQIPGGEAPAMRLVILSIIIAFLALIMSEYTARKSTAYIGRKRVDNA